MHEPSAGYIYTSEINKIGIPILHALLHNYDASIFYRIKHFECSVEAQSSNGVDRIEIWLDTEMKAYQNFSNESVPKLTWMWEMNGWKKIHELTFRVYDFDNKDIRQADFPVFIISMG